MRIRNINAWRPVDRGRELRQEARALWAARRQEGAPPTGTMFTLQGDLDWAFCTPVRSEACPGWALYVAGRLTGDTAATVVGPLTESDLDLIRSIEADLGRPIGVLLDLQGPKLRVGTFAGGPVQLVEGARFRLDLQRDRPGDATRVALPHPEILAALVQGTELLLDDGRHR